MTVISDLRSSRELLGNLALREIRGKYKRTALGQAWSLVNPIALMFTYSVVFSVLLKSPPDKGNPSGLHIFALWLSCALLPWMFFANVLTGGMSALISNANLVKKVYFPRETLVIADMLSWLFTFSIEMVVLVIALMIFGASPLPYLPLAVVFMVLLACMGLGLALMLAVANVYFRDTQHFVAILMQLWFYATPIVYPEHVLLRNHQRFRSLYELNPMERFSTVFRNLIYDNRWPTWHNDVGLMVVSIGILGIGLFVFRRFEGRMAEEL
ncbi:MAG: lipopolysaccharide transport system permease protein [Pseudonocardiales bacterium]|jgi:ABC-2 type transport system permease protein|nr:lipopolysaccharide transport system permease protein [Pseudonocardiales bacterium]